MEKIFTSLFESDTTQVIDLWPFFICIIAALAIGAFLAYIYKRQSRSSQSFVITLAIIPAVVCMVIMLVNGNVGAGVAVAGAFSLVRFRSIPGTAREIGAIFIAMGAGLTCGIGYIGYAVLFTAIMGGMMLLYQTLGFGINKHADRDKTLHVTIPEDLDYTDVFDDLFEKYTVSHKLTQVKTTNMGSLFKLTYDIKLKSLEQEKAFIDEIRCRNGNLEIGITQQETGVNEL